MLVSHDLENQTTERHACISRALFGLTVAMMAYHATQPSALLLVLLDAIMFSGYLRVESELKLLRFIDRHESGPTQ